MAPISSLMGTNDHLTAEMGQTFIIKSGILRNGDFGLEEVMTGGQGWIASGREHSVHGSVKAILEYVA